jgi:protein pelota
LNVTEFDVKHKRCSLTIENADDLWTLRRLISKGDTIVTRSSRVVKKEEEYSRPDKGERVKVTIAMTVDDVHLDSSLERLKVRGTIKEASDETVTKAGSHSVNLTPGHSLTLVKDDWTPLDVSLVRRREDTKRYVIVAVDRTEAGVGRLAGTHLSIVSSIESGLGGKMSEEQSSRPYVNKVADLVAQTVGGEDEVVVAGPGNFKNLVTNQIRERLKGRTVTMIEGFELTGADGVRALVRAEAFQRHAAGSQLVEIQKLVSEAVKRVGSGDGRVAYSVPRVKAAAEAGAVDSLVVSDDVFATGLDEQELISMLNQVESNGGRVYLADSSMEFGKQVSSFGGVLALLRYVLRA